MLRGIGDLGNQFGHCRPLQISVFPGFHFLTLEKGMPLVREGMWVTLENESIVLEMRLGWGKKVCGADQEERQLSLSPSLLRVWQSAYFCFLPWLPLLSAPSMALCLRTCSPFPVFFLCPHYHELPLVAPSYFAEVSTTTAWLQCHFRSMAGTARNICAHPGSVSESAFATQQASPDFLASLKVAASPRTHPHPSSRKVDNLWIRGTWDRRGPAMSKTLAVEIVYVVSASVLQVAVRECGRFPWPVDGVCTAQREQVTRLSSGWAGMPADSFPVQSRCFAT